MKTCSKCKKEKPFTEYYPCKSSKDGYRWQCKVCHTSNKANKDPELRHKAYVAYYQRQIESNPSYYLWRNAKSRAKQKNLEFSISVEDVIIPKTCPYLGMSLERHGKFAPSIDRIDSTRGYVTGNIQVISRLANAMKNSADSDTLVAFAKGVLALHSKGGTAHAR